MILLTALLVVPILGGAAILVRKGRLPWLQAAHAIRWWLFLWLGAIITRGQPESAKFSLIISCCADFYAIFIISLALIKRRSSKSSGPAVPVTTSALTCDLRTDSLRPMEVAVRVSPQELFQGEIITISGSIDASSASLFAREWHHLIKKNPECVTVQVQTEGGLIVFGWSIHEQLRLLAQLVKTNVLVTGPCYSAGVPIIMAVPRERRFATKGSEFMIHRARCINQHGSVITQESIEEEERANHHNEHFVQGLIAQNTAILPEDLQKLISSGQDYYLNTQQALELGIIGGIV